VGRLSAHAPLEIRIAVIAVMAVATRMVSFLANKFSPPAIVTQPVALHAKASD
jgi:hypothetical protein